MTQDTKAFVSGEQYTLYTIVRARLNLNCSAESDPLVFIFFMTADGSKGDQNGKVRTQEPRFPL